MSKKPERYAVVDIETTGLDPHKDEITRVGVLIEGKYYSFTDREDFLDFGINILSMPIVGHNISFDIRFLLVKGWLHTIPKDLHDTQLMAHVCTRKVPKGFIEQYEERRKELNKELPRGVSHRPARSLSLKVLAPYFLKVSPFWETPEDHSNEEYNRKDCEYTDRLFNYFWPLLEECGMDFYQRRMVPWAKMLLEMTMQGINLNTLELDAMQADLSVQARDLEQELRTLWADHFTAYEEKQREEICTKYAEMASKAVLKAKDKGRAIARYEKLQSEALAKVEPFNFASPEQMKWLLKERLGLDISKLDDDEEESTGKAVLNKLANEGNSDIELFLKWRGVNKILTSFLPTYMELQVDGKLHPSFNITGTRTGRTSSSNPNLQQVPSSLYKLFSPSRGYKFIIYDLSGIEAALIALYSGDQRLFDILSSKTSIHDHNAKILFNLDTPVDEVKKKHPKERQTAKNLGFATFYGAGWRRLQIVFQAAGFTISDQEAKQKLQYLKNAYRSVFQFHRDVTDIAAEGGILENLFGRPIIIPDPQDAYMKAFNTLVQSSASDLNLRACEKAKEAWAKAGLNARPLLVIHDCIVAEAKIADCIKAEQILVDSMTDFKLESENGIIKLQVEGGISDKWEK